MYRDNDSGLRPSSYPYILGRALNEYRIKTSVTIYIVEISDSDLDPANIANRTIYVRAPADVIF